MIKSNAPKNDIDIALLRWVLGHTQPYKVLFWSTLFIAILLAPVNAIKPYLIKVMTDDHILSGNMDGLVLMAFIYGGVVVLHAVFRYLFIYNAAKIGQSVIRDIRIKVFDKILSFPLSFFDKTPIGTATTRTINDIEAISKVFEQGVLTILADLLSLIAVIGIMFYTSWRLTLICLIMVPFLLMATYIFKEKVKASYQRVRSQISKMNAFLQERISGMKVVQIFNAEDRESQNFYRINKEYLQANLNAVLYYAVFFPVVELTSAFALALMVWWGAGAYLEGHVSFGALVAFPLYLNLMFRPIRMLADKFNSLQMGLVAAQRVKTILDMEDAIPDTGKIVVKELAGKIEFRHVTFAYIPENPVLKDVSFLIPAGQTLAIVGSTGSGKTTIINLLNRFYDFQKGKILIDDIDIRDMTLLSLRSHIAIVLQDVFLFTGTILENITLRDEKISIDEVKKASQLIGADKFIESLPGGYAYMVMERGNNLSVGQRQLISMLRAMVFDPDILILDEATSSIDTETEAIIQYAIEKVTKDRTSIVIAHRLSTIRHADQILVLDKGRVIEIGSHDELLALESGKFKELYELQWSE